MTWVTWRQHRLEGMIAAVAVALLASAAVLVASQLNAGPCPPPNGPVLCFPNGVLGSLARSVAIAALDIRSSGGPL